MRPHPLPAHVRTIRIEALETPWVINSCHAWREGGPLHQWLAARQAGRE